MTIMLTPTGAEKEPKGMRNASSPAPQSAERPLPKSTFTCVPYWWPHSHSPWAQYGASCLRHLFTRQNKGECSGQRDTSIKFYCFSNFISFLRSLILQLAELFCHRESSSAQLNLGLLPLGRCTPNRQPWCGSVVITALPNAVAPKALNNDFARALQID